MKKILTKLLALSGIGLLMLAGCKKSDPLVVNSGAKSSTLTASATTLVLDKTRLNDTSAAIMFTFTAPAYNYKAVVKNSLQIDAAGDNWKNPTSAQLGGKGASQGYSTAAFNALVLKLNLPAGKASQVNVRVVNALSSDVATYSNTVSVTVTPFNLTSFLYVVGQFNGYSTATADSIISPTSNGIYTGIINFPTGDNRFLVLPARNYDNKYATTASPNTSDASITYATEYVTGGGSDLYAPAAAGNYLITLNTNTNTITVAPTNGFSVIGTVTPGGNYSTDEDLKYVNDGNGSWAGTFNFTDGTFPGAFKVRQNHDWTWSWGVPKPGTDGDGIANTLNDTQNNNIPIATSGTYKVTFNIVPTAFGTNPSVTATYTVSQ